MVFAKIWLDLAYLICYNTAVLPTAAVFITPESGKILRRILGMARSIGSEWIKISLFANTRFSNDVILARVRLELV